MIIQFIEQTYILIRDKIYTLHSVIFRNVKMVIPSYRE